MGREAKDVGDAYLADFYELITDQKQRNLGIRYELIHSDAGD